MRLLLDTHALLWASVASRYLSGEAHRILIGESNNLYVSPVSAWEAGMKHRRGLLPEANFLFPDFEARVIDAGYRILPITCRHAEQAAGFVQDHKDPFDRMLAAQSIVEGLTLVSKDKVMDSFGVSRIW